MKSCAAHNGAAEVTALTNVGQHHNKSTEIVLGWGVVSGFAYIWVDRQRSQPRSASAPEAVTKGVVSVVCRDAGSHDGGGGGAAGARWRGLGECVDE